jgi:dTDP-4-dehydrorhamnose reductase
LLVAAADGRLSARGADVLIVGLDGRIGRATAERLRSQGATVAGTTRRPGLERSGSFFLDLARDPASWPALPPAEAALVCAGETSQARCQAEPAATRAVNVRAVGALGERLARRGTFVLFLSSNLVFDGSRPFARTTDPPSPTTEYGRQKADAEAALSSLGEPVAVLRLSKVLTPDLPLLARWRQELAAGASIEAFSDVPIAPLTLRETVAAITGLLSRRRSGLFQISGDEDLTYLDLGRHLAVSLGLPADRVRARAGAAGLEAERRHTTLDMTGLQALLGLPRPSSWAAVREIQA